MPVHRTACPRNCYRTCTMLVQVEEGRITRIAADAQNRATPDAVCLKGLSYVERLTFPDRLLKPLRKILRSGRRTRPLLSVWRVLPGFVAPLAGFLFFATWRHAVILSVIAAEWSDRLKFCGELDVITPE